MHCLLCHEKIPRLRAWAGKSEFCCDEHAELYKKQTMDRLLVDDSVSTNDAAALPILGVTPPVIDHVLLKGQAQKAMQADDSPQGGEVDELWNLAERTGVKKKTGSTGIQLPGISEEYRGDVPTQSADEALAALQALAAQTEQDSAAGGDLLDEFSSMDSSFEGLPHLESLPIDLAAEIDSEGLDELDEAPELELDAFELPEAQAETRLAPELVSRAVAPESIEAPDLQLEGLAEAQQEALEPPELAADFDAEPVDSLEPPEVVLEELLAAPDAPEEQSSDISEPPEPADFDLAASEEAPVAKPEVARAPRRNPKAAPRLRPSTELQEMSPSPNLPEGGYEPTPWMDALASAGPDRSSLLSPIKFADLRKSSLNGTAAATFDPVLFRASESAAAVAVPISEPENADLPYSSQEDALKPCSDFAWPMPLHAVLIAAEMKLNGQCQDISLGESSFSVKQPTLSDEFLSSVALQSRILEPQGATILSPHERDAFASAAAEEEESGSESASAAGRSDRDETDGGERAHVADLF